MEPVPKVRVQVIAGADHFFSTRGLDRIAPAVVDVLAGG